MTRTSIAGPHTAIVSVGEGEPWARALRQLECGLPSIRELDQIVEPSIHRRLVTFRRSDGEPIVGHGIAGYLVVGGRPLYIVPKCFSRLAPDQYWGVAMPAFLAYCRGDVAREIVVMGDGAFATSRSMSWWWADRFSRSALHALKGHRILGYRQGFHRERTVRGRIVWARQAAELGRGGHRVHTRRTTYTASVPVNHLLGWATRQLLPRARAHATRARLREVLDRLNVEDVTPSRHDVRSIRLTPSQRAYQEPVGLARAMFEKRYPTLARGSLQAQGFLIDMQDCFELFIDGLVHRAGRSAGPEVGGPWSVTTQGEVVLARVRGNGSDIVTKPDNTVSTANGGVVIDAKYKGVAPDRGGTPYHQPKAGDIYQVLAGAIARGWRHGVLVSPQVDGPVRARGPWHVSIGDGDQFVLRHLTLDLRSAANTEGRRELVRDLQEALATTREQ